MKEQQIRKHLNKAIDNQVPDVWDDLEKQLHKTNNVYDIKEPIPVTKNKVSNKRTITKRLSMAAAICLIVFSTLTFTPALAAIQEVYEKLFLSKQIDDIGVRTAIDLGYGKSIGQTYFDKQHDITVRFEKIMTDDKETKLLLIYQSDTVNLENYYIDLFEGYSSINISVNGGEKKKLATVGWGSRYYEEKENKVVEALSFESIKSYEGMDIRLEIKNLTIYGENSSTKIEAIWPFDFKLDATAVSDREKIKIDKEFTYKDKTYRIKRVEFSALETRVVVTGPDTKIMTDETGMRYEVLSELEQQFLNARKIDEEYGYIVNENKSGVFLRSAGKRVDPIFSKGEVQGEDDEYIMIFAPVENRKESTLEVGKDIKIPLTQ